MDDYTPPEDSLVDHAIAVGKAATEMVPGAAIATAFAGVFFSTPLQRRQQQWMLAIAEGIRKLESQQRVLDSQLREHDAFLDILYSATAIASRTSNERKLLALQNFIFNAAVTPDIDEAIEFIALGKIADCSGAHLHLLQIRAQGGDWTAKIADYETNKTKWDLVSRDLSNMQLLGPYDENDLSDTAHLILQRIADVQPPA